MPVSGLVLTLESSSLCAKTLAQLARDARITLGEGPTPLRVPAVIETESVDEAELLLERLREVAGIVFVDVVSLDFSDLVEGEK
jgi:hypothetical protein